MPPPPRRLEGLNGAPKAGRFAPKTVNRRSKEEREASAPVPKPEPKPQEPAKPKAPNDRWKTRSKFQGTRAEAAGPLAAPIAGPSSSSSVKRGASTSVGSSGRRSMVKSEPSDMGLIEDIARIGIDIADDTSREPYFPMRVSTTIPESNPERTHFKEGEFYLLQLPDFGLDTRNFRSPHAPEVKAEEGEEILDSRMDVDEEVMPDYPSGKVGSLKYYASGRVTMVIGDSVYEVTPAAQSASLETLLVVDNAQGNPTASQLGKIDSKYIVIPDLSVL